MSKTHPDAEAILSRWPNRQAVADDAGVEPIAVYRWEKRNSIPAKHDSALIKGARKRRIRLNAHELISLRAPKVEQLGHKTSSAGVNHDVQATTADKDRCPNGLDREGAA